MKKAMRQRSLLWIALFGSAAHSAFVFAQSDEGATYEQDVVGSLDEIIVTARRTDERLQEVPISITVFSQEQLDSKNIVNGGDLATYTPSLTANTRYSNESTSFAIRGFSQEVRTTASVGTYFADVVMPRANGSVPAGDNGGPGMFFDLQNVQIMKGPQGTLNGRNTTGGAILLVPQEPTADLEGYLEQSAGNYGMLRTQAVFNTPLSDSARFRIGMDKLTRDGYIRNRSGIGPKRFSDIDYLALRASLIVDLADSLENYTILSWSDSSNNGPLPKLTKADGNIANLTNVFGPLAIPQAERQQSSGYYTAENADPKAGVDLTTWSVINTTTWNASDELTVKNIVSYAQQTYDLRSELFGTNLFTRSPDGETVPVSFNTSRPAPGLHTNDQTTMTEEFQLQGEAADGAMTWQAGLYFEYSKPDDPAGSLSPTALSCIDSDNLQCYDVIGAGFGDAFEGIAGSVASSRNKETFKSTGIYSQASYDLTDDLVGTLGLRYTTDTTENESQDVLYKFYERNQPTAYCQYPDTDGGSVDPVSDIALCNKHRDTSSEAPTWVIGLDYKPSTDLLVYGKYSRGYRQGSLVLGGAYGYLDFDPEQVDAYELGMKTSFDAFVKGSVNMALFYNDFKDQQVLATFNSSTGAAPTTVSPINAGSSRIYGAELESTLLLVEDLSLGINYAYLNTKIEDLTEPVRVAGNPYDTMLLAAEEGDELTYTPHNKLVVSLNYQLPFSRDVGVIAASTAYSYTGSQLIVKADESAGLGRVPSNELVSANISWMGIYDSAFDASIFVTNLFDKEYKTAVLGTYAAAGFSGEYAGEPRMFGARLRYSFGG